MCVVLCLCPPNKPTNGDATKSDHGHLALAWDHMMLLHHVLVLWAPLTYPWSERTKPLGGRAAAAQLVVACFVLFCVLWSLVVF